MKGWIKLALSLVAIYGFIVFTPTFLEKIKIYQNVVESSEKHGIDNNSVFYSDEPISYKAEKELKESIKEGELK